MAATKGIPRPTRAAKQSFRVATLLEVGEFFGVGIDAVNRWRGQGMPGRLGRWDLGAIARWDRAKRRDGGGSDEMRAADLRLKQLTVESREFELQRERGLVVDRADVELWAAQIFVTLRECLSVIPESIATSAPAEIRALAREEADRVVRAALTMTRRRLEVESLDSERTDE